MVDVAREVGADAVSHGCTGKGNDQARIKALLKILKHLCYSFLTLNFLLFRSGLSLLSLL